MSVVCHGRRLRCFCFQLAKSDELKGQANAKFQENHFSEAIELYSAALEENPLNHVLLANRAFCQLKLENYGLLTQLPQLPPCSASCNARDVM